MNYLPSKLLKLRKHYNYSQSYLADVLGVDTLEYMAYENGRDMINYAQAKKLASLYHISMLEVFRNSDEVTLYDTQNANTDEINIEYFTHKKTLLEKLKEKPLMAGIPLGIIIGICMILFISKVFVKDEAVVLALQNKNRLSLSETSLIYIDELGGVRGSGDNANGQLSNLPSSGAVKVCEGANFSLVLFKDGTLKGYGVSKSIEDEISDWKDIVDIASGDNHVVGVDKNNRVYCAGSNDYGQCDLKDFSKTKDIYATANATIAVRSDGKSQFAGEFIGKSVIRKASELIDIDSSADNLIVLYSDGTCEYVASRDKNIYMAIDKWKEIVDVTCGNDFFAGLKSDGSVLIAIDNYDIKEKVESWKNIIAIDSGDDYIVAYDGEKIYGAGINKYNQFEGGQSNKQTLSQVKNITIDYDEEYIYVKFDAVTNASGYKVSLDVGSGITYKIDDVQTVKFDVESLKDEEYYYVSVVALGSDSFMDSSESKQGFIYTKIEENEEEIITVKTNLLGSSKLDFETYLKSIGVGNLEGSVDENSTCLGLTETVEEIKGITPGSSYDKSALNRTTVKYKYCKLENVSGDSDE